jgi:uncharacterized membrane protein
MPDKQMFSSQTQPLRDLTNIKFEVFIVAFTVLPFFILAYFYSLLPERVPQFLTLTGEVATWVEKSVISIFRVPLMAVLTQIVCLLMRYGTLQSGAWRLSKSPASNRSSRNNIFVSMLVCGIGFAGPSHLR